MLVKITPKFDLHSWTKRKIGEMWFQTQNEVEEMGKRLHNHMITYIATKKKRGQSPHADGTISLEKSITLERIGGTAMLGFGIGNIKKMQKQSPHWYVLNYGCTVFGQRYIPNYGKFIPGSFGAGYGQPPYKEKRGTGKETFYHGVGNWGMKAKTPIHAINYIESTKHRMGIEVAKLFAKLKSKSGIL